MKRGAYYNEIDPFAAAWLRNLIAAGIIAPGDVDERDIRDVHPDDLKNYTQCHFFAGIGAWSYALRRAGWPNDRPVWTGSCPCQPFSAAGKGKGEDDERHLWPAWFHLIDIRRPAVIFGEQVASKSARAWLDLVHADLEGVGYSIGAADICSAGVGAPNIRQRLFYVADRSGAGLEVLGEQSARQELVAVERSGAADKLADADTKRRDRKHALLRQRGQDEDPVEVAGRGESHELGDPSAGDSRRGASPLNGFWRDADWLRCRDGKWRPVEPGTFPLVTGAPARVGRLRGYGNAINAEVATQFSKAYLEVRSGIFIENLDQSEVK